MKSQYAVPAFARFLDVFSKILILLILLIGIMTTVPRLFHYQIFHVVSGSMEPAIPVGSAAYVKESDISSVKNGDIIAYRMKDSVILHRAVRVLPEQKTLITKGDANEREDIFPVESVQMIGIMKFHIPVFGGFLMMFSSAEGKRYLIMILIVGGLCELLSVLLKKKEQLKQEKSELRRSRTKLSEVDEIEDLLESLCEEEATNHTIQIARKYQKPTVIPMKFAAIATGLIFVISSGFLMKTLYRYHDEKENYQLAAALYTMSEEPVALQDKLQNATENDKTKKCPITVDFDSLQETNSDIGAWIYAEDTMINYPVMVGVDNQYYLTHGYEKESNKSGSIFMEEKNETEFQDMNTIFYGHHMKNHTMFAGLSNWSDQSYYESHKELFLLTPGKRFRVELLSGFYTTADSDCYEIYKENGEEFTEYMQRIMEQSLFEPNLQLMSKEQMTQYFEKHHVVMLSTCEYTSENARYVLYGALHEIQ